MSTPKALTAGSSLSSNPSSKYSCTFQLASPLNYDKRTTAYTFAQSSDPVQLCQKREDGSYDCAPPTPGMGGLGAPQGMYCVQSDINSHINCFNSEYQCELTVAKMNGCVGPQQFAKSE